MLNCSKEMEQKTKIRTNWRQEGVDKTFLESCSHEITLHGREGGLKPVSWRKIAEKLKTEHDFIVDQKQMKNRFDYLKLKFTAWLKLRNKTGNVYNPVTNMFSLSEEEWQLEIQSNKNVESLRRAPLDHPELCIQLFQGSTSTGVGSWGPSSTLPRPSVDIDGLEDISDTQMQLPRPSASEESSGHYRKKKPSTEGVSDESTVRSKKRENMDAFKSELIEVGYNISKVANMLIEKHNDMDACMEKLNALGWGKTDARYQTALLLLCNHFHQRNWLHSSRSITLEEKMAMFFIVIGHNERIRMVKRRFQHSTETIHRCFHEVLNGMMNFAREIIVPTSSSPIVNASIRHRRLMQIFPGAIGALDGTLVHAVVPTDQQNRYRGRGRWECFQNVLGICNFDMIFTFVWAGWEGIAHDSRVLKEVAFNPTSGFHFPPPDKYYLCDAAYTNTRGFMAPYRNARYWLADVRRQRVLTKEEKFNHAHAQLRNVIERAYGVLKARFPILKQMAHFPLPIQRDIVIACFAIHNFIRKGNIRDELFMSCDENNLFAEVQDGENDSHSVHDMEWGSQGIEYMTLLRDEIATQLMPNV